MKIWEAVKESNIHASGVAALILFFFIVWGFIDFLRIIFSFFI